MADTISFGYQHHAVRAGGEGAYIQLGCAVARLHFLLHELAALHIKYIQVVAGKAIGGGCSGGMRYIQRHVQHGVGRVGIYLAHAVQMITRQIVYTRSYKTKAISVLTNHRLAPKPPNCGIKLQQ